MYKNFFYSFPTQYVFGDKAIRQLDRLFQEWRAERVVIFHGSTAQKLGICADVKQSLEALNCAGLWIGDCPRNPDTDFLAGQEEPIRNFVPDFFLAAGGGSVIDAAKGMAAYLGRYDIPIGAISTLPASGSESNRSFVVKDNTTGKKVGKADSRLVPKFAICDPGYTLSLTRYQINCALADIMSHLLEQYFCLEDFGLLDRLILACIEQLVEIESSLAIDHFDMPTRQNLVILASFALSYVLSCGRTLDWVAHTIEHSISGVYNSNHGEGLSIIMPRWISYASGNPHYRKRLEALGQRFSQGKDAMQDGLTSIESFFAKLNLSSTLEKMVGCPVDMENIARLTTQEGSLGRVNPIGYDGCLAVLLS
jgi:alcohol dehydrogenase YqhD (iron-dependent ADH family)